MTPLQHIREMRNRVRGEIEVHYTCRHSDKYDFSCGDCQLKTQLSTLTTILTSLVEKMEGENYEPGGDYDCGYLQANADTIDFIKTLIKEIK